MSDFDPEKALSDKTYWYPHGLLNDRGKFSLISDQNSSVMRYVWHGCFLPTTVADYATTLGIPPDLMPGDVEQELGDIVRVFSDIKGETTGFRDKTWPSMVGLASNVYNYAAMAGGRKAGSYYYNMLDWARQYHDEAKKTHPDKKTLEELQESIAEACKELMEAIKDLKDKSKQMRTDLGAFKSTCVGHEKRLDVIIKSIQDKLGTLGPVDGDEQSTGKIGELKRQIKKNKKILEDEMKEYDKDVTIAATTPSYAWLGLLGFIAAATVAGIYGDRARRLEKAISEMKDLIQKEQDDIKAIISLEAHFIDIQKNVSGLRGELDGAIQDLARHEGVWESIRGRLEGLGDFVKKMKFIRSPLMEKLALENIISEWNELKEFADDYRRHAFEAPTTSTVSVDEYLRELRQKF